MVPSLSIAGDERNAPGPPLGYFHNWEPLGFTAYKWASKLPIHMVPSAAMAGDE
jgi:hypothetical protein